MLDKATYINHLNQTIEFGTGGIYISSSELRDYEWLYDSNYNEITNFHKDVVEKSFKIIIYGPDEATALTIKNRIFEVFERDVLFNEPGRMYINGFYCNCFIKASKKERWFINKRYLECQITMVTDQPDWKEEKTFSFVKAEQQQESDLNLKKYDYTYPYFYKNQISSDRIQNNAVVESDFLLRIYGPTANPVIMIGENVYQVNVIVGQNERLEVDSDNKSIYLIHINGRKENIYWSASKLSYIFEKIPTGLQVVAWDGSFAWDLILINSRSEPIWL